jgi:hypothetical protein
MRRARLVVAVTVLIVLTVVVCASMAAAQRGGGRGFGGLFGFGGPRASANPPYDGRFMFTRVRYEGSGRRGNSWADGYPRTDRNLSLILDALTAMSVNTDGTNVLDLEDPDIFRHPVLFIIEPGFWRITDQGAANFRAYLLKGGFAIFDDFEGSLWNNFEAQFRRALPEAEFVKLDLSHPIYRSFFDISEIRLPHPSDNIEPAYYGVFLDNDPRKRLMAIANHNSDVAEYWDYSGTGQLPVDTTNDAYKLGVNYMIYALTH